MSSLSSFPRLPALIILMAADLYTKRPSSREHDTPLRRCKSHFTPRAAPDYVMSSVLRAFVLGLCCVDYELQGKILFLCA